MQRLNPRFAALLLIPAVVFITSCGEVKQSEGRNADKAGSKAVNGSGSVNADANDGAIQFLPIQDAFDKAKRENKIVFLSVTQTRCGYCRKLDNETFTSPAVQEVLETAFVPAQLNTDAGRQVDWNGKQVPAVELQVMNFKSTCQAVPCFMFMKGDGNKFRIQDPTGFRRPQEFLAMLRENARQDYLPVIDEIIRKHYPDTQL